MSYAKLRQQLAEQAARLMFENQISFQKATQQAVQRVGGGYIDRKALPTQREIRAEIAKLAWLTEQSDDRLLEPPEPTDRFVVYASHLAPLEQIPRFGRSSRGEDLLSHSLRTFDVARDELPYDEEFLTAALLHEIGRAVDPQDAARAALDALGDHITERTAWLIEHLEAGRAFHEGSLGQRSRRRHTPHPPFCCSEPSYTSVPRLHTFLSRFRSLHARSRPRRAGRPLPFPVAAMFVVHPRVRRPAAADSAAPRRRRRRNS